MEKYVHQWRLVIELLSPMQIGIGSLGMVEKTGMYIPGRVMWGALTSTLVRQQISKPEYKHFKKVGESLGPHEKFLSSFFPSFDNGKSEWLPVFEGNSRSWVKYICEKKEFDLQNKRSEEEMQAILISGQSGNATDPERMATFDKSLHETDMISPLTRKGEKLIPVCFTGTMQLPEKLNIPEGKQIDINGEILKSVFNQCRLGGGRKRGWGIVRLISIKNESILDETLNTRKYPYGNVLLTSATHPVEEKVPILNGRAFLATYRQYCKNKGQGRSFTSAQLCWETGTLIHA
jgi:hypothetical protein